jgi:hypothetical protein
LKFYRIDWPEAASAETCTDWSTSWDEAHKIGRAHSDYYKVILVELPERKSEMLSFLRKNIRRQPYRDAEGLLASSPPRGLKQAALD